jgi:outer membrane protein assembly factor BamD
MQALDEVVRKYPGTEYAESARRKIEVARDQLAGKEMLVGRYYLDRRNYAGAINRFKAVVTQYQTTRHVEEALMRLTECYMALGIVPEAQTAAAVLGHNFPDSPWYKDAYKLVTSGGAAPREDKGSWISRAFGIKPSSS